MNYEKNYDNMKSHNRLETFPKQSPKGINTFLPIQIHMPMPYVKDQEKQFDASDNPTKKVFDQNA
jgi:hypothetical protein